MKRHLTDIEVTGHGPLESKIVRCPASKARRHASTGGALAKLGRLRSRVLLAVLLAAACQRDLPPRDGGNGAAPLGVDSRDEAPAPADAATFADVAVDGSSQERPPIPSDPLFTNLTVSSFPEAVVSVPNGATSPRPTIVVLHGSGDRPDWNCDAWRHITGAAGFVLCPRGDYVPRESTAGDARFTLRGGATLRAHVETAFGAMAERFEGYVDLEQPLAVGFSLGAWEIAHLAVGSPARFSRVALVEGGDGVWTAANVRAFAQGGGRRVLFACGSPWCTAPAKAAVARLRAGGVQARLVSASVGHSTDRPLQEAIMRELPWFLDGDPRWTATAP